MPYLKQLYQSLRPYACAEQYKQKDAAATQGEILFESLNRLLPLLSLQKEDIFLDLGSGTGRVTAQVFLQTPVCAAWGIEFIPELHKESMRIAEQIQKDCPEFFAANRQLNFIQGNFLEVPWAQATVLLMNSVCFSQATLARVGQLINKNSNIRAVLSLRPLPTLDRLAFIKTQTAECTWDTALAYLYC